MATVVWRAYVVLIYVELGYIEWQTAVRVYRDEWIEIGLKFGWHWLARSVQTDSIAEYFFLFNFAFKKKYVEALNNFFFPIFCYIQVFTNDGMPNTICDPCRLTMDFCYRFKQICKKADTVLKQFPLTGVWPAKYELPIYPEELLPTTTVLLKLTTFDRNLKKKN